MPHKEISHKIKDMGTDLFPCYREDFFNMSNSTALPHRNGNKLLYTSQTDHTDI